jgi:hypothetical protein
MANIRKSGDDNLKNINKNIRIVQGILTITGGLGLYWTIWGLIFQEIYFVIPGIPTFILGILGIYFNSPIVERMNSSKAST